MSTTAETETRRERTWLYLGIVAGGALGLGLLVPFLFHRLRKPSWRQPEVNPS